MIVQHDLNIVLMNELSMIFTRLGISTDDVLKAAGTKWNFNQYRLGMVGGHSQKQIWWRLSGSVPVLPGKFTGTRPDPTTSHEGVLSLRFRRGEFGFVARVPFEDGLKRTVEGYRDQVSVDTSPRE